MEMNIKMEVFIYISVCVYIKIEKIDDQSQKEVRVAMKVCFRRILWVFASSNATMFFETLANLAV